MLSQFAGPCHQGKERVTGQPLFQSRHQREDSEGLSWAPQEIYLDLGLPGHELMEM